jgi:hypothetical protein
MESAGVCLGKLPEEEHKSIVLVAGILRRLGLRRLRCRPLFPPLPKPEEDHGRHLVDGQDQRGEDEPIDVHLPDEEENEGGQTGQGEEDGTGQKET